MEKIVIGCEIGAKTEMTMSSLAVNMVPFLRSDGTVKYTTFEVPVPDRDYCERGEEIIRDVICPDCGANVKIIFKKVEHPFEKTSIFKSEFNCGMRWNEINWMNWDEIKWFVENVYWFVKDEINWDVIFFILLGIVGIGSVLSVLLVAIVVATGASIFGTAVVLLFLCIPMIYLIIKKFRRDVEKYGHTYEDVWEYDISSPGHFQVGT